MKKVPLLSIIIPVYDEEKNIKIILERIAVHVKSSHEILIVYDYDGDRTVPIVNTYISTQKTSHIYLVKNAVGDGKGVVNAIKTGFGAMKGEASTVVMADLSDDVRSIDPMYKKLAQGFDIVCASRYMSGGSRVGGPIIKGLLSRLAGLTLYYFFHVPTRDATNAFKTFKKHVLESVPIESTGGFEYSLELVLKAHKRGFSITEVPTKWVDRTEGASRFRIFAWLPKYIKWYLHAVR